ncbi:hypothetical protein [Bordetella muralis]|jgi:hypothetical protein|uniref:hypothetical protein n=1 Tax=Bordetella muralis TaxID=1649130 RepID=UPI0039EF38E8
MADDALRGDLANVSDAAKGAALVGYLSSGQGAIGNTVSDKLNECVSVLDFGARPNNALDPVSVWLSGTEPRFASFADLQTAYPHVTSLT